MNDVKFNKFPCVKVNGNFPVFQGWDSICERILSDVTTLIKKTKVITVEYYQGVLEELTTKELTYGLIPRLVS